jgi:phage protein D
MRGYVRDIQADYPAEPGATSVVVECQDESLALDREHVRRDWGGDAPTSDTAIVQEIVAGRHGATVHPDSGAGQSALVRHQDSTDIRFLRQRAQANGYELIFREGSVYFGPMCLDADPQPTILVYAGRDTHCIRLSIKDDGHMPDRVGFDIAADTGAQTTSETVEPDLSLLGNESASSAGAGLGDFTWRMSRTQSADETELRAMAQHRANEQSMKISAEGELDGSMYGHVLRAAEPVGVDGVGERYGGVYYVDRVTHRFDTNGYRQTFRLLRNAYGDNLASSSSPLAGLL